MRRYFFLWRSVVLVALFASAHAQVAGSAPSRENLLAALKSGGHVLLLRHAQTEPGIGDPPNFRLGDCSTQRNLSTVGRTQTRQIAAQLRAADIRFDKTLTSEWCRCRDTANLIADRTEAFSALNSFFEDRGSEPRQTREVKARMKMVPATERWLLVTHQVNISALTGITPSMGEGVVVRVKNGEWVPLGLLAF
jgi:phosphohistidine phosphatase SixA